ncbi:tryptophan 2,3-dioxygenase [Kordiimonas sediminis]|uniref:Tryptophan 2,3-dioxygenase n=1 Tax=Kordiimonas sediminis TaxID=1735581 RepID=A0A919E813_9PROT|nr:tryptophan 2,3-dioxygenase family protein [Kordiimonas sediminis]GHF23620.1 tryptophan 2,3-dioxygenase [Kordiimonas sediminis]
MSDKTAPSTSVDLSGEKIHWNQDLSYGSYLQLEPLLQCQKPVSGEHDEMLFIVIHQATELWLRACLHEIGGAMQHLIADDLGPVSKMLSRVSKIQANLQQSWEILSTMTPADYAKFRDSLGQSSGFQSFQYREVEYRLGNKNAKMAEAHKENPAVYQHLQDVLDSPSFYDLCIQLLAKRGFDLPESCTNRQWREPYAASDAVENAWLEVYQNTEKYWDLYELAEKLVDLEHHFHQWRFAHMKTVERIIGYKRGTGGTGGVSYLVKALDLRFFPELWTARTKL